VIPSVFFLGFVLKALLDDRESHKLEIVLEDFVAQISQSLDVMVAYLFGLIVERVEEVNEGQGEKT